jgi:hypothetical protein
MIRNLVIAALDRLTSLGVGAALAWLAASLHIVIDSSSAAGVQLLAVAVLAAVYDMLARLLAKRIPVLAPFLGVQVSATIKPAAQTADGAPSLPASPPDVPPSQP